MSAKPSGSESSRKSFREIPVGQRSIWQSWAVLPARTRLNISLAVTGFALLGIFVSNKLETALPSDKEPSKSSQAST